MYKFIGICGVSIVLLSCSSNKAPLTHSECETLAQKEAANLASRFNQFPEMKKSLLRLGDSRSAQCAAGKVFDREDYKCVMAADGNSEMEKCLKVIAGKSY